MVKDALAERDRIIAEQRQLLIRSVVAIESVLNEDEFEEGHLAFLVTTLQSIVIHLHKLEKQLPT